MFERRGRLPIGTFSEPKKIGEGPTDKEQLEAYKDATGSRKAL